MRSKSVRSSNKVRFGITKKRSFRGGGDCVNEILDIYLTVEFQKRSEVYGEVDFPHELTSISNRIINMVQSDNIIGTANSLDFSGVTPLNVTDLNATGADADAEAKVNSILDNSAINLLNCHGGIMDNNNHKVVPSNTIICFIGVLDHLTAYEADAMFDGAKFLKTLIPEKFKDLFLLL